MISARSEGAKIMYESRVENTKVVAGGSYPRNESSSPCLPHLTLSFFSSRMASLVSPTYREVTHFYQAAVDSDDGLASDQEWDSEIEVSSTLSFPPVISCCTAFSS